jgi:LPS export ABC transporter permease LptF
VRIFTRYILREILSYALLGGVLFTFILFMRWLPLLMELAVRGNVTPADLGRLISYLLPSFITFTLPMAVLVGILLGLSRLAADSEVTAMRASGLGVLSFLRIVSIMAVICWGAGLVNSLYIAPRAAQALLNYEADSKSSQATIAVEPHVFYEGIKDNVLYVQDVVPGPNGTAIWKHVFLADLSNKASPHIISANDAVVVSYGPQQMRMDLTDGSRHDTTANNPNQYDISTFRTTELPIQTRQQEEDAHLSRRDTPTHALSLSDLRAPASAADVRPYQIELYSRFAGPTACLVLMLVGVPLGLSSRRGGKGSGFVLTLLLVFLYYILSASGIALARQGKLSTMLGVWGANIIFGAAGLLLIQQMSRGGFAVNFVSGFNAWAGRLATRLLDHRQSASTRIHSSKRSQRLRRALRIHFPLILDEYVMGSAFRNFLLVIASLIVLFLIFTFFELIGDIIKNRTPLVTVGEYLFNLIPFIIYNVTPLSTLIAVLITFGTLNRTSELTAMKATGTSLYRMVAPVLLLAAILSAISPAPTAVKKPCSLSSKTSPLRPSSPTANGCPARPLAMASPCASSTTSISTPRRTNLPTSPSSNSSPARSISPAASLPKPHAGMTRLTAGCSKMAGNEPSPAPPSPAISPSPSPHFLRSTSYRATSRKKTGSRRRCPTPSSPSTSTT